MSLLGTFGPAITSPSSRRAWIELFGQTAQTEVGAVALLAEGGRCRPPG